MKPLHIVLHEPVIPQNTGSIARLCACTGAVLHLIHPLGFKIDEAAVKRAGLDYWPYVEIKEHASWNAFFETEKPENFYFYSKFSKVSYVHAEYTDPCYLIFGSETKGLPQYLHKKFADRFFKVPMRTNLVRSLNLSQCAAVVAYEVLRRQGFQGD